MASFTIMPLTNQTGAELTGLDFTQSIASYSRLRRRSDGCNEQHANAAREDDHEPWISSNSDDRGRRRRAVGDGG